MKKILLLDDDQQFLSVYAKILSKAGYEVLTETDGNQALLVLKVKRPDVIICDLVMPEMDGLTFLRKARILNPKAVVIILTGEGSISGAVEAMKEGAYYYLSKPVDIQELLLLAERAAQYSSLSEENIQLKNQLGWDETGEQLIGNSPVMVELRKQISFAAASDASVLITGESGTGKELVAMALHQQSGRAKGPLIKVNCGAMTETLLESELFGHEKGAFTGAVAQKTGRFERANGGTLFLDEIGEASPAIQTKLLRAIQEKEIERVGGTKTIPIDFRLITATNQNLNQLIDEGRFREDLYYRIHVIPLELPPLRERVEDIPLLLSHFLKYFGKQMGKEPGEFTPAYLAELMEYKWPGNVRELKNFVERVLVFSQDGVLNITIHPDPKHKGSLPEFPSTAVVLSDAKRNFEKNYLLAALKANHWNVSATAKNIGIARNNLQKKMKEYHIENTATKK
jgi:DNA-binding NtrC family response regulator